VFAVPDQTPAAREYASGNHQSHANTIEEFAKRLEGVDAEQFSNHRRVEQGGSHRRAFNPNVKTAADRWPCDQQEQLGFDALRKFVSSGGLGIRDSRKCWTGQ